MSFITDIVWATENRRIFFHSHLNLIAARRHYTENHPRQTGWGENVSVFLIAWNDIPRLTLGSFPHFWLHLAVITSIVTKHTCLLHPHQNHWCWYVCLMMSIIFSLFSLIVLGNKVTQNHMLVPSIDYRCWGIFWGLLFQFGFCAFLPVSLLLFCSVIDFSSSYILGLAVVYNLLTKTDCYWAGCPRRLLNRIPCL